MTHHLGFAGLLLFVIVGNAPGQQATNSPPAPRPTARSSYDPMAQGKTVEAPKGIVETTLAGINPRDKDYGQMAGEWRKEVFENILYRAYFWGLLLLGLGLGMSLVANGWFVRERERRLAISADIVTQLYNAYIGSRARALEVIAKYNSLVDRYNTLDGEKQRLADQIADLSHKPVQPELDFNQAREDRGAAGHTTSAPGAAVGNGSLEHETEPPETENLRLQLADFETKLQRKTAQLQAKDNQITNLRERLSRAHDNLEGQRKAKTPTV